MFDIDFMEINKLENEIDKNLVSEIREYLIDKDIGLT